MTILLKNGADSTKVNLHILHAVDSDSILGITLHSKHCQIYIRRPSNTTGCGSGGLLSIARVSLVSQNSISYSFSDSCIVLPALLTKSFWEGPLGLLSTKWKLLISLVITKITRESFPIYEFIWSRKLLGILQYYLSVIMTISPFFIIIFVKN